jgi:biopolymer transport protein ExbB/TolQ
MGVLHMTSLLWPYQNGSKEDGGIVFVIWTFAKGAAVLLLFLTAWWRLSKLFIPLEWYFIGAVDLLWLMTGCSASIIIERSRKYLYAHHHSHRFVKQVGVALGTCDLEQAIEIAGSHARSPSARVTKAGLVSFQTNLHLFADTELVGTAERVMRRMANATHLELRRGLTLLACVSSAAPLVGVFGTLAGIMAYSFQGYSGSKSGWIAMVADGISKGLVPTAWSVALAVLTQWCCKHLLKQLKAFDLEMKNQSAKVLNLLIVCLEQRRRSQSAA